jgi:hypothetical protein
VIGDTVWIGDGFGPFLIRATLDGRITGVFDTLVERAPIRSPDNPALQVPAEAGADWQSQRSGGYEGIAFNPESGRLWALLEKPLVGEGGEPEGDFLRLLEFDPEPAAWTGASLRFPLGAGASAIGDINFIDASRARHRARRRRGRPEPRLCRARGACPDCFPVPARVKRIVLIDTANPADDGTVTRIASIDLMAIEDPDGRARLETASAAPLERFTFPFQTIENVVRIDDSHILVINDNNLPFSTGRQLDQAAANEFILLSDLLDATLPPS